VLSAAPTDQRCRATAMDRNFPAFAVQHTAAADNVPKGMSRG
jgi:hypothetical protein